MGTNKQGWLGHPTELHTSKRRRMDIIKQRATWHLGQQSQNGRVEKLLLVRMVPEGVFTEYVMQAFE